MSSPRAASPASLATRPSRHLRPTRSRHALSRCRRRLHLLTKLAEALLVRVEPRRRDGAPSRTVTHARGSPFMASERNNRRRSGGVTHFQPLPVLVAKGPSVWLA